MLIDTHMHLYDDYYKDENIDDIFDLALKNEVKYFILGSSNKDDNIYNQKIVCTYDNVFMTCGFHPEFCLDYDLYLIEKIINSFEKVVGIGEIGLDFHYGKDNMEEQVKLFEAQLALAEKYKLPVVIHTRDAISYTYDILSKYNVRGVIHCFSGSYEMAKKFVDLGFFLGIGGVVTFKNSKLIDVVGEVGIEKIVLETDSPYLSPIRGKINYPANVKLVAEFISKELGLRYDDVCDITTKNAFSVFNLDKKNIF